MQLPVDLETRSWRPHRDLEHLGVALTGLTWRDHDLEVLTVNSEPGVSVHRQCSGRGPKSDAERQCAVARKQGGRHQGARQAGVDPRASPGQPRGCPPGGSDRPSGIPSPNDHRCPHHGSYHFGDGPRCHPARDPPHDKSLGKQHEVERRPAPSRRRIGFALHEVVDAPGCAGPGHGPDSSPHDSRAIVARPARRLSALCSERRGAAGILGGYVEDAET